MYANNKIVLQLISLLKQFGIRKVVVSPGCRHRPLIYSLEQDSDFKLYSVVDERSAAFFALGLIQQSGEPVAVACTSGTACQNYGSAVVEAFYQHLPLLVLSGDRLQAFLGQNEGQMYDQGNSFRHCSKYQCTLPYIQSNIDEWHANRLINEALIELTTHGRGPVHINYQVLDNMSFAMDVKDLPVYRKINWHHGMLRETEWAKIAESLKSKKVAVLVAQGILMNERLMSALNEFCKTFDAIVLTENIANCHLNTCVLNTWVLLQYMNSQDKQMLAPDIIITLGGMYYFVDDMRQWMLSTNSIHWQVGNETKLCDQFHNLRDVFEMDEADFFNNITEHSLFVNEGNYSSTWLELSSMPQEPVAPFGEMYAIGRLLKNLPKDADLQLANSYTMRVANLFEINPKIQVHCNRALSGIDGSLSTAVGYATASEKRMFYITGDLSFFYDMNALSIKHLPNNFVILMINNDGGACLYQNNHIRDDGRLPITCASNHFVEAKGWVESCGFRYIAARNMMEVDQAIDLIINTNEKYILEVFTNLIEDAEGLGTYFRSIKTDRKPLNKITLKEKIIKTGKRMVKQMFTKEKIQAIKILLHQYNF